MKEINIGSQTLRVRATPPALLYYKQEFKGDLVGDLMKLSQFSSDPTKLDTVLLLQIVWAMAKADSFGKGFPSFEKWLHTLESIDFSDPNFITDAMEEAANGFFRSGVKGAVKPNGN